jgi:hypothetical protein
MEGVRCSVVGAALCISKTKQNRAKNKKQKRENCAFRIKNGKGEGNGKIWGKKEIK